MQSSSARVFNCARCRCQVVICSHCDRGNIYCGGGCSQTARRQSLQAAGGRYQRSRRGRGRHAERQHHYRRRRQQKVTHQGSPSLGADETLRPESKASARWFDPAPTDRADALRCSQCGRSCSSFLRQGWLRRPRIREPIALSWPLRARLRGP
jgi:hypothetical protein